jgi:hypothetical protein
MRTARRAGAWVGWICKRKTLTCSLIDQEAPAGNCRGLFTFGPFHELRLGRKARLNVLSATPTT